MLREHALVFFEKTKIKSGWVENNRIKNKDAGNGRAEIMIRKENSTLKSRKKEPKKKEKNGKLTSFI